MKFLLFILALPIFATPSCNDYSFTNQDTVAVPYSTHGHGMDRAYRVKTSGVILDSTDYSVYYNSGQDVWLSLPWTISGVFTICGSYTLSSASTDFQPVSSIDGGTGLPQITVCGSCTASNYAYRAGFGAMSRPIKLRYGGSGNAYIRVYLSQGRLVMATSNGTGGNCIDNLAGDCIVATNVSDFPTDSTVKQIAYGYTYWNGSAWVWSFLNDLRSF